MAMKKSNLCRGKVLHWIRRKYGEIYIHRVRKDGEPGVSLPCVICRKRLEKLGMHWKCHLNSWEWASSQHHDMPPSVPTPKQKRHIFAKRKRL